MLAHVLMLILLDSCVATNPLLTPIVIVPDLTEKLLDPLRIWSPPSKLNVMFLLFTQINPFEKEVITSESIRDSSFNPRNPIKILIHGYRSNLDGKDVFFAMKDALLKEDQYNVIIVNWTKHNDGIYDQAVVNGRAVGAELAEFLKFIVDDTGAKPEDIHLIGHSLGSHIAGWAGKRIPGLGRITGLDPVGIYFRDNIKADRLDASDAEFVDVIHTDSGSNLLEGLGMDEPMGDMDFYPNGGRTQPGCGFGASSWFLNRCSHDRAVTYFLESIDNSGCHFISTWCNSYADFEKGECGPKSSTQVEMGLHAKSIPGVPIKSKFFLQTNAVSKFCIR